MAETKLNYTAAQINSAISKILSLDVDLLNANIESSQTVAAEARSIANLAAIKAATAGERAEVGIAAAQSVQVTVDEVLNWRESITGGAIWREGDE